MRHVEGYRLTGKTVGPETGFTLSPSSQFAGIQSEPVNFDVSPWIQLVRCMSRVVLLRGAGREQGGAQGKRCAGAGHSRPSPHLPAASGKEGAQRTAYKVGGHKDGVYAVGGRGT